MSLSFSTFFPDACDNAVIKMCWIRVVNWPKLVKMCVFCGSSGPQQVAQNAASLAALQHNLQEAPDTSRYVYMSGRGQAVGKRSAACAYDQADYPERVSADCGIYGSPGFRRQGEQTGVNIFSFWCA